MDKIKKIIQLISKIELVWKSNPPINNKMQTMDKTKIVSILKPYDKYAKTKLIPPIISKIKPEN